MEAELKMIKDVLEFLSTNRGIITGIVESVLPLGREVIQSIQNEVYDAGMEMAEKRAEYYQKVFQSLVDKGFTREEAMLIILNSRTNVQAISEALNRGSKK